MTILQAINFLFFLFNTIFLFLKNFYVCFGLMIWVGLMGGSSNGFLRDEDSHVGDELHAFMDGGEALMWDWGHARRAPSCTRTDCVCKLMHAHELTRA